MYNYDVIIIGAGPAGIFASIELTKKTKLKVLLLDSGPDLDERKSNQVLYGFAGAGAFSDGKLTITDEVGGDLNKKINNLMDKIHYVDDFFIKHGAPTELSGTDNNKLDDLERKSIQHGLHMLRFPVRHMGSDGNRKVMASIRSYLDTLPNLTVKMNSKTSNVVVQNNGYCVSVENEDYLANKVIVCTGRGGARNDILKNINLKYEVGRVDIGVRLECPAVIMNPLTEIIHDLKLKYYTSMDDCIRTFCCNPKGYVSVEENESDNGSFYTVNGYSNKCDKSNMTNMALLCSTYFTEPFDDVHGFGEMIARLSNTLGGKVMVQRVVDLMRGRRSTESRIGRSQYQPTLGEAFAGDVSFAMPYRQFAGIMEMLKALNGLCNGVTTSDSSYIYSPEVKFYGKRYVLGEDMQTVHNGLYVVGDCSGWTRGILQAGVSGVIAAEGIINELS